MLTTKIVWFGRDCLIACDHRCEKAWGINGRRHFEGVMIDFDGEDDVVYLADSEVGEAPDDPGTYEGGHGKPDHPQRHNKWCARECERSSIIEQGKEITYPDYSVRRYNIPANHEGVLRFPKITTGEIFEN